MIKLSETQIERYTHHITLKDIGGEGQKKLLSSKVLVIGAGGLGSPSALYLAAAGLGTIGIVDHDRVEVSNLQRQILHATEDVGREKTASAQDTLCGLNPEVHVKAHNVRLNEDNVEKLIDDYDFVIDATDNFTTKFLINDACVWMGKPYSHAGVVGFKGQTFTYVPGFLCYRCIFADQPPPDMIQDCRGSGILGAAAGTVGSIQAAEAIKFLLGRGDLLTDKLLTVNLFTMEFRTISLRPSQSCPSCQDRS